MTRHVERDNWSGPTAQPLARTEDPPESKAAARAVKAKIDRGLVLGAYRLYGVLSYREAGERAAGPGADTGRIESLRRRCSDLKKDGLIEQIGTVKGQGVFGITQKGYAA